MPFLRPFSARISARMPTMLLLGSIWLALAACGTAPPATAPAAGIASSAAGTVRTVERVDQRDAGIGVGTIAGVAVGGTGGTSGGARQDDRAWRVTLSMDDGSQQVFATPTDPQLRPGDRIQIVNGIVMHY